MSRALIIFIKNPVLGKCKTRLASGIGDNKALSVYNKLLSYTRKISLGIDSSRYLYYDSNIELEDDWSNDIFIKKTQAKGDLGARMSSALSEVLTHSQHAIIIGSDCPQLSPEIIEVAYESLKTNDICLGPTHDGGYYLIGMRKNIPELFQNITWSSSSVYEDTIRIIEDLSLTYKSLPVLSDLDDAKDLAKFPQFNP